MKYELVLKKDGFDNSRVIRYMNEFKNISDVIVAVNDDFLVQYDIT